MDGATEQMLRAEREVIRTRIERLTKERQKLDDELALLRGERARITRILQDPRSTTRSGLGRYSDSMVVKAYDLGRIIRRWCETYDGDYPLATLARRTGYSKRDLRRIKNNPRGYSKYVMYSRAEKIIIAMGREEVFGNGELEVLKNPYMKVA